MSERRSAGEELEAPSAPSLPPDERVARVLRLLESENAAFLEHPYFKRCSAHQLSRAEILKVLEQLYCFSRFFERLMTHRVAEHSSANDPRILEIARAHLSEELGHVQQFRECLVANGASPRELGRIAPRTYTKALFGYLLATIEYEHAGVTNVAMLQVMESTAQRFFAATVAPMHALGMATGVIGAHAADDVVHSQLGVELIAEFDRATLDDCARVMHDIYRLMNAMLDDWLAPSTSLAT